MTLPSDLDVQVRTRPAMAAAVQHERALREGYARDALDELRMHITTFASLEYRKRRGSGVKHNKKMEPQLSKKQQVIDAAGVRYSDHRQKLITLGMKEDHHEFRLLTKNDKRAFVITADEQTPGDSRRSPSWIWGDFGFIGKAQEGSIKDFMLDSLRVHWFRHSALASRWTEEVQTEYEEMFRTVKSHKHDMNVWEERAKSRKEAGRLGAAAYARR
ncbi:hypothetical protein L226DRAFT_474677 [Lentinus tigrinus ALCF2SS1-7]|uniref:Uncharacterized protein n=1 Tax=Lentinus tigrinus ALCF2SS1-6 TaxID=1328759 RepID=A0A5C2RKD5_9APHY|nr:hypothetical protein L227DRAFT_515400 [Lentinus tigrinus ALCF2SS1-6]RPD67578.1 hypothetical protein L226DRAFT_474677 [Lentinus tigrinus ALCF2SS1-7]